MNKPQGFTEFRRGWPIVLASMLGVGLGLSPLPFYTIGVLAPPMAKEFGWGMGQIFLGITVNTFVVLGAAPLAGWASQRLGVRRVAIGSLVLFSLAFMGFALSNGSLALYYATWAAVGLLGAGTLPMTWTRGVNAWFDERKGLALGLTLMGTGLFGMVSKPLTTWLVANFGWRGAYVGLALLPLLLAAPVAWALFRNTDGDPRASVRRIHEGYTLREVLRQWRFWLLAIALLPISFTIGGPIPNMETILKSHGFVPADIVRLTPLIGLAALVGRLAGGWLIDRFWAPAVASVLLCLPAASCWLLADVGLGFHGAALAIALIGFAAGVEYDLMAYLVARYFGMRSYSAIYSLLYCCFAFGAGTAPAVFGWSFDRSGSYVGVLLVSMGVIVLGALSLLALGRYPRLAAAPPSGSGRSEAAERPASLPSASAAHNPIAGS